MARNPFGHVIQEDAHDELAGLVGEKGAGRIFESLEARLPIEEAKNIWSKLEKEFPDWEPDELKDVVSSTSPSMSREAQNVWKRFRELKKKGYTSEGVDDVPWDEPIEEGGYGRPIEPAYYTRPKQQPRYTGLDGSKHEAALKKGYVDLGLVDPKRASGMRLYAVASEAAKAMKNGVVFVRDPENVLGAMGVNPAKLANEILAVRQEEFYEEVPYAYEREDPDEASRLNLAAKMLAKSSVSATSVSGKTGAGYKIVIKPSPDEIMKRVWREGVETDGEPIEEVANPMTHPPTKPGETTYFEKTGKVGVVMNDDGSFTAMTRAASKDFKTYKAALAWLQKNASFVMSKWTEEIGDEPVESIVVVESQLNQGIRVELINVHPGDFGGYGARNRNLDIIVTGDTYPVRAELKKMGLWFDKKARGEGAWVMRSGYNDHPEHPKSWGVDEKKLKDTLKKVEAFAKDYNAQLAADNAGKLTGAGLKDDPYVKGKMPPRKLMKRIMSMGRGNQRLKKHGIVVTYEFPSDHGGALGGITGASTAWVVGDTFKVKDELKKMGFRFNRSVPSDVEERAKKEGVKKVQAGWSMDGATFDRIERSFIERLIRAIEGTLGEDVDPGHFDLVEAEKLDKNQKKILDLANNVRDLSRGRDWINVRYAMRITGMDRDDLEDALYALMRKKLVDYVGVHFMLKESDELDEAVDMGMFKGLSSKGKQLARSVGPTEILHGEPGEIIIGKDVDDGPELDRWVRRELPGRSIVQMKPTGYVSKEDAGKGPWALLYKGGLPKLAPGYKGPLPSWAK